MDWMHENWSVVLTLLSALTAFFAALAQLLHKQQLAKDLKELERIIDKLR